MPLNQTLSLALLLTANTSQAYSNISKFSTEAQKSLSKMRDRVNRGLLDVGVGMQVLKPIKGLVDKAVDFEDAMAGVAKYADAAAIGTKNFNNLSQKALSISTKWGVEARDVRVGSR